MLSFSSVRKWVSVSLDFQENPLCFQAVFSFCFDSKQMKTWLVMGVSNCRSSWHL